jgi:hypothetical protein
MMGKNDLPIKGAAIIAGDQSNADDGPNWYGCQCVFLPP